MKMIMVTGFGALLFFGVREICEVVAAKWRDARRRNARSR